METQTHAFEADVSEVLNLVIHSLYSNKEIFLRELVSNASDALDRLRFKSLTDSELMGNDETMEIRLYADPQAGTVRIEDTGIGMSADELVQNLGTIAHSGSRALVEQIKKAGSSSGDLNLIGQFGVGFYSGFLVADRVEVVTRAAGPGSEAVKWSSTGKNEYVIEPAERAQRGTEIVLFLRDEQKAFADTARLSELVRQYSDYVGYPIKLEQKKVGSDDKELVQVNRAGALWQRPKSEITEEQLDDLYRHLTRDLEGPLTHTHFTIEGTQQFVGLLYVPKRAPWDLFDPNGRRGVRLFVKRVFIMDDCDELLPPWLRWIRGVIDSDDLPLNVSRELLQDSSIVRTIRAQIIKKSLDMLEALAQDRPDDYLVFWKAFGAALKEGLVGDPKTRDRVAKLIRASSTKSDELTSLDAYIERMPEEQKAIYYLVGESIDTLRRSPYLEALETRGYEVLLFSDAVDDFAIQNLGKYNDKELVSAMRDDLELGADETKAEDAAAKEAAKPLIERAKRVLGDRVKDVRASSRLSTSPCCLALDRHGAPAFVERLLKERGHAVPGGRRVFELNPKHALVVALEKRLDESADDSHVDSMIELLFAQATLLEGAQIDDTAAFAARLTEIMQRAASSEHGAAAGDAQADKD